MENYPEMNIMLTDGEDTDSKQILDVEVLIAKAMSRNAKIIVLDEPTAVLG